MTIKLELIPDDDPRLHTKCEVFNPRRDEDFEKTVQAMFRLMWDHDGMGLAAPQVGIQKRFFIMYWQDRQYVCANPTIIKYSREQKSDTEGCLSYPGEKLNITRASEVKVSYQDIRGRRIEKKFKGVLARCFQHELDHLNGIVFRDRVD